MVIGDRKATGTDIQALYRLYGAPEDAIPNDAIASLFQVPIERRSHMVRSIDQNQVLVLADALAVVAANPPPDGPAGPPTT
jgi:hypothetical protein